MALSPTELRLRLSSDEPDYAQLAQLIDGSDVSVLLQLANDPDPMLASKAVYLASLLPNPQAHDIVVTASNSPRALVRIASASALVNLPDEVRYPIADRLIDADDVSVKKLAIKAVEQAAPAALKQKLDRMSRENPSEMIRNLSKTTLQKIN
ncbi:hypothetical protein BN8_01332 [Fibrisoma limi BUZ 3]|uniref:HEAT repeat domain-containing protein n=1 Tax=Fibrisoma limi BUZ 3 TaxID=1185876 RepID=I2GEL3_9BACT|nr:HEAT repeat domain-containing protein [Fibrisoma limi]CCH52338.1 hypothetical protein BN8_01332 [Fibrisoma limi BUZ 3]